jgi:hypothetical protein
LRSFFDRPQAEQRLLARALTLVAAVRLSLWFLPARSTLRAVGWYADRVHSGKTAGPDVIRIGWAIRKAASHVPGATCLTQALAARLLLARHHHASQLYVGVARKAGGGMDAHAWVEAEGRVIVGGGSLERFTRMPDFTAALSSK